MRNDFCGLTNAFQTLARPYAIAALATAAAAALWRNPSPDMLTWVIAGLSALAGARTADKIWGQRTGTGAVSS